MRNSASPRSHSAFTLVELLVVIAVIAVLVGMLIPALSQAREAGYKVQCLSNMRQIGLGLNSYAAAYKNHIPGNAHNADQIDAARGPYTDVGPGTEHYAWESADTIRHDNGANFTLNGQGLLLSTEHLPNTKAGIRLLWCPAEKRSTYNALGNGINGVAYYWDSAMGFPGLQANPFSKVGSIGRTAGGYAYRSLGAVNGSISGVRVKQSNWNIETMPRKAALIDICTGTQTGPVVRFTHGSPAQYTGLNRLFFDGSANWMSDTGALWRTYLPTGSTTVRSNTYQSAWAVYDR